MSGSGPGKRSYLTLAVFVAGCLAIGFLGSFATSSSLQTWYPGIRKPFLNPPNWVFAPVWSVLYICMAVAGWRLWHVASPLRFRLRTLFICQLAFNAIWSPIFFGSRNPLAGLVDILLLWSVLLSLTRTALREDRPSGFLLMPYLFWVSFATYLNAGIWWLNR
jgi:tryptophan-rich sensory protein